MKNLLWLILLQFLFACKDKTEKTHPHYSSISESVYASGSLKSKNQYYAFANAGGILKSIMVKEGDTVKKGSPLLFIANDVQRLSKNNAELAANYADFTANQGKLNEAKLLVDLAKNKLKNDSVLFARQGELWRKQIGTKVEYEQRELAFQNAKTTYVSALVKYHDLKRVLELNSNQSKTSLQASSALESEFTLKSEINGVVYSLLKKQGELVGPQTALAVIGDATEFILEMQVDEYDVFKVKPGMPVLVSLDSYKGQVFDAVVSKIYPIMNDRSKTFLVEANFEKAPPRLYPNISFEASIVIQSKEKALLVPRNYLIGDTAVLKSNGEKVRVSLGLKDYQKAEILSGISESDELQKPLE
ncbi:MAG TPA: efflux RND transporter periplasmic adaptor subunit [Bacteroidia bacterium]|nr:efflux RND transporter periplasmic adaptor subunit [Bacteroidia bacterium]HRH07125.1 efflux RND transporter periplasmic adaptor subunit [Bacteroidia bacterium]